MGLFNTLITVPETGITAQELADKLNSDEVFISKSTLPVNLLCLLTICSSCYEISYSLGLFQRTWCSPLCSYSKDRILCYWFTTYRRYYPHVRIQTSLEVVERYPLTWEIELSTPRFLPKSQNTSNTRATTKTQMMLTQVHSNLLRVTKEHISNG